MQKEADEIVQHPSYLSLYSPRVALLSKTLIWISWFQVQLVQKVIDGVNTLVDLEKNLEKGRKIDDLLPRNLQ